MAKTYPQLIEYLSSPLAAWAIDYRVHATRRMFKRHIKEEDVRRLLETGVVIEEYHEDFPLPSVLVNGLSSKKRPLHAVIGVDPNLRRLYVITVYEPDLHKWTRNYSRRIMP